jgi:hypothetical protein
MEGLRGGRPIERQHARSFGHHSTMAGTRRVPGGADATAELSAHTAGAGEPLLTAHGTGVSGAAGLHVTTALTAPATAAA